MSPYLIKPGMILRGESKPVDRVIRAGDPVTSWRDPSVCDKLHVHVMIGGLWKCYHVKDEVRAA